MEKNIETYARRDSMLKLRETLAAVEEGRMSGRHCHSIDEVTTLMKNAVREVLDGLRKQAVKRSHFRL